MTQLGALLLSLAIEVPVATLALTCSRGADSAAAASAARSWRSVANICAAATLLTHPLAWSSTAWLANAGALGVAKLALIELLVVLAETMLFRWMVPAQWPRALAASAVANAASFAAGVVVG